MHTTPALPAFTSRTGASLSFVLLTQQAAPCSRACSQAFCFSVVHACSGTLVLSLVAHALLSFWYQSASEHSTAPVFSLVALVLLSSRFESSSSVRCGPPVFRLDARMLPVLVLFQLALRSSGFQSGHTRILRLTVSVCSLTGASPRVQPAPQCKWLLLPGARECQLPIPFIYLPISVRGFTLPASYLNTQR